MFKFTKRNILEALIVILLVIGAYLRIGIYMLNNLCVNNVEQTLYSPEGKYKVVVFVRDCGATTDFSKQVSVIPSHDELNNDGGNFLIFRGEPQLSIEWATDTDFFVAFVQGSDKIVGHLEETPGGDLKLTKEGT